jgi:hypothetical protein
VPPGQWFTLDLIARGNRIVVKVDGVTTADYTDEEARSASGHIALQLHHAPTKVEFRKIEVQELDGPASSTPPPTQPAAATAPGRFPAKVLAGAWTIEGDELVQSAAVKGRGATILFGDPEMSQYDFSFKARAADSEHGYQGVFHCTKPDTYYEFAWANYKNTSTDLYFVIDGKWGRDDRLFRRQVVDPTRWADVRVEVRGPAFRCFVDGDLVFQESDARFTRGQVGLSAWDTGARFKDIRVTSPDGRRLLLAGLPDV